MVVRFDVLAAASEAVAQTSKRIDKIALIADAIAEVAAVSSADVPAAVAYLTGETLIGRLGVGYRTLQSIEVADAAEATLTIGDVTAAFAGLAQLGGPGSQERRHDLLEDLFRPAIGRERRLLWAIIGGELRQGALAGVVTAGVAKAAGVPVASVQRAAMFLGSLPAAAEIAWRDGRPGLDRVELVPGIAVQPMLASPAESTADAIDGLERDGGAVVQWKFDGARVQAHRVSGAVNLFTRNLNDVTSQLPTVVAAVAALAGGDLVLDGEVMGVDVNGLPAAFQDTIGDFSASDIGRGIMLAAFWFDVLAADGEVLVDRPLRERLAELERIVPVEQQIPSLLADDATAAQAIFDEAVEARHEGVVVKDPESVYLAGKRGRSWRKLKPVHTFDLIVLAVERGHGRRSEWLSNLHLGALDDNGDPVMVGKTFKGLTDEMLAWQTKRFGEELAIEDDGFTIFVRPEQVVEVAIDGVQRSTRYTGGVALRFARVKRYRNDKSADGADSLADLQKLLAQ